MSDAVAGFLTTIRNATRLGKPVACVRYCKICESLAAALERSGYIWGYSRSAGEGGEQLAVNLRYTDRAESIIDSITSVSTPGRRVYVKIDRIKRVQDGLGIAILSTNKGVLSDNEAREQRVGGELLCTVF